MKITIESTPELIEGPDGIPAWEWEGTTGEGHKVKVLVVSVLPEKGNVAALRELAGALGMVVPEATVERLLAMMEQADETGEVATSGEELPHPPPMHGNGDAPQDVGG